MCLFHVFVGVVREFFCGDAWLGFVCVVLACVCSMYFNLSVVCDWLCDVVLFAFSCELFEVCVCYMCSCVLFVV